MRACALRDFILIVHLPFKGMYSEEQKEPKAFMLLLSDFKIKNHYFKCFHGRALTNEVQVLDRALTNEVQVLENSFSGRYWLLP